MVAMLSGYFSLGDDVNQFIVLRDPPAGYNDIAMSIGQLGLMVGLFIGTAIRINSNMNLGKLIYNV